MRIDQPSFSGSITQAPSAYAELSGSFTGSYTGSFSGSFIGDIAVEQAEFSNLTVKQTLNVGTENFVDGVDVLDSALAFSIALG